MLGFIDVLSHLTAERFVVYKTGATKEHELDEKTRALQIEVRLDDNKTYTLTIGKQEEKEKKSYYAQSSSLPGDVFLVSEAGFAKVLTDGPGYFGK